MVRGIVVSDTAWRPCGSFFTEWHINFLADRGMGAIRLMLNYTAWTGQTPAFANCPAGTDQALRTANVKGIDYRDYIKSLVDAAHARGMLVEVDLSTVCGTNRNTPNTMPSYWGDTWGDAKQEIITKYAQGWANWGAEVANYVRPDILCIMNEPGNIDDAASRTAYLAFVDICRATITSVPLVIPAYPWHAIDRLVPYQPLWNCYVPLHWYYRGQWTNPQDFITWANGKIAGLNTAYLLIDEFGKGNGETTITDTEKTALQVMEDWAASVGIRHLLMYAAGSDKYAIFAPPNYNTLTPYGEYWLGETVPPPTTGTLEIHAFLDGVEVTAYYEIIATGQIPDLYSGQTPTTLELGAWTYPITVTYQQESKTQSVQVLTGQTVKANFTFTTTPPPPPKTYAARVPMMPHLVLAALKKLRDRFIRKEVHEKVHPII